VETDTTGRFKILVNKDATAGEYTLSVATACGHAGPLPLRPGRVNGPVIVFLAGFRAEGWDVDGKWVSNATITDANVIDPTCGTTLAQIFQQARDGNVYVNVQLGDAPAGVAEVSSNPAAPTERRPSALPCQGTQVTSGSFLPPSGPNSSRDKANTLHRILRMRRRLAQPGT